LSIGEGVGIGISHGIGFAVLPGIEVGCTQLQTIPGIRKPGDLFRLGPCLIFIAEAGEIVGVLLLGIER